MTQMGTIRLGKRTKAAPLVKDFVPLADLNDVVLARTSSAATIDEDAGVLDNQLLDGAAELSDPALKAVFDASCVKHLDRPNVKARTSATWRTVARGRPPFEKDDDLNRIVHHRTGRRRRTIFWRSPAHSRSRPSKKASTRMIRPSPHR